MGPKDTWERMRAFLAGIRTTLPSKPRALLIVSAHWEEPVPTVTAAAAPSLYYDYYGFPPHTYELKWPAPGHPALALRVQQLLESAGFPSRADGRRGLDHGVFIPLKVAWPEADIPSVQLSLMEGLDPAAHLRMGRALEPLRDEGVLIVGSGMSYHNMRAFMTPAAKPASEAFDAWLARSSALGVPARDEQLCRWSKAPSARASHPREEHLLPLMVVAGAAGQHRGEQVYRDEVMGSVVSAVRFG